jgi:hypothetical protein
MDEVPFVRCLGLNSLNYCDHAREANMPIPKVPVLFLKPRTALNAHIRQRLTCERSLRTVRAIMKRSCRSFFQRVVEIYRRRTQWIMCWGILAATLSVLEYSSLRIANGAFPKVSESRIF